MIKEITSQQLFEKMKQICQGISDLEFYEFEYLLKNIFTENNNWESMDLPEKEKIEEKIKDNNFYLNIKVEEKSDCKTILDKNIKTLTQNLFSGIIQSKYNHEWINRKTERW